ncbi:alkanesulfonate monooxygenase [Exophiala aquamarina CBS 119918]|uniref:Alkanesulfonate monooxygenase n=1 Tax=Exophiala aquamarina CBS 119918 TaxID=1182545 RepID=A0A072PRN4_9EURO|nr:alkanesulfonate monooxygenase [Exophiala aquamarina CBS 119918]KEF62744.1 alkanesulfonate monooxygenase [Exophiala aquamarina CBS 119918]
MNLHNLLGALAWKTALVGSVQTIVDSRLEYVKLGAELISFHDYDNLNDAIDYGRFILSKGRENLGDQASKGENASANGENGNTPLTRVAGLKTQTRKY